jgi:hypothetical protein
VPRGFGSIVLAMCWIASAVPVAAGTVRGSLFVPRGSRLEDAVVWLERVPDRTERELVRGKRKGFFGRRQPPPRPELVTKRQRFDPRVVVIAAGDTLLVRNEDRVWHGVFSVSPTRPFELGKRGPGSNTNLPFSKPGQVQVRCDIHPGMSATVLVTPNHAFTRPNAAGEWTLPDLPEGAYVVRAWAPGLRELHQETSVTRRGEAVLKIHW